MAAHPDGAGLAYGSLQEIVSAHAGVSPRDADDVAEGKLSMAVADTGLGDWLTTRLRPLLGLPGPTTGRDENFLAWTRFFESIAQTRPAVVVIEDLHWASESTVEFLRYFKSHASDVPMLLVGTARPEFVEKHPDVLLHAQEAELVDLRALSSSESSRLADVLLGQEGNAELTGQVAERCGGNPLFAEELARSCTIDVCTTRDRARWTRASRRRRRWSR